MPSYIKAVEKHGSARKAAKALGMKRQTFTDRLNKEKAEIAINQHLQRPTIAKVSKASGVKRFIFTCAVKGAKVHADFFANLQAYAKKIDAELVVGPLTSVGRQRFAEFSEGDFDEVLAPFLRDDPIVVGDRVRYSPELNLAPTMVKPLQGLQTYTKKLWSIFPHTKICVDTVATQKDTPAKFMFTTGCVTHPHYTPTKAGFRAHFDHVHGALIVEVSKEGVWARHLTPTDEIDGTFYDLDKKIAGGKVQGQQNVEALVYGDIHVEKLDMIVAKQTWGLHYGKKTGGNECLTDLLMPNIQVFHDLMDMSAMNYHEMDNFFKRARQAATGDFSVLGGCYAALGFMKAVANKADRNYIVASNHDDFVEKFLLRYNIEKREDFDNAEALYKLKINMLRMAQEDQQYPVLEMTLRTLGEDYENGVIDKFKFLLPDESLQIKNVECGWHGHLGPNGRRGSRSAFKFVTEKSTIAHLHSPGIESGCHVVGTSTEMDLGYNKGPSSWAHTHGIIYPHGGRTLITMSGGRFWADQPVEG